MTVTKVNHLSAPSPPRFTDPINGVNTGI